MTQFRTTEVYISGAMSERDQILAALDSWVAQRPGLEFGNYGDVSAYRAELRGITKDLHHYRTLRASIAWRVSITAESLTKAFDAFSGLLTWDGQRLDYCTGQYWPTEYRKAACAVLARALWDHARECLSPERGGDAPGCVLRADFRKEYGKAIASRWFS